MKAFFIYLTITIPLVFLTYAAFYGDFGSFGSTIFGIAVSAQYVAAQIAAKKGYSLI